MILLPKYICQNPGQIQGGIYEVIVKKNAQSETASLRSLPVSYSQPPRERRNNSQYPLDSRTSPFEKLERIPPIHISSTISPVPKSSNSFTLANRNELLNIFKYLVMDGFISGTTPFSEFLF
jgi:hypothetical protein